MPPTGETPVDDVIVAQVPGDDPSKFVTLTLAHPLRKQDHRYLGLPEDAKTRVGSRVKVNRNGAQALINAGLATVDPENRDAVRAALTPESTEQPVEAPAAPTGEQGAPAPDGGGEQTNVDISTGESQPAQDSVAQNVDAPAPGADSGSTSARSGGRGK